jgi:hypothetical protein
MMVEIPDEETTRTLLEIRATVDLGMGVGHDDDIRLRDLGPDHLGVVVGDAYDAVRPTIDGQFAPLGVGEVRGVNDPTERQPSAAAGSGCRWCRR